MCIIRRLINPDISSVCLTVFSYNAKLFDINLPFASEKVLVQALVHQSVKDVFSNSNHFICSSVICYSNPNGLFLHRCSVPSPTYRFMDGGVLTGTKALVESIR